MLRTHRPGKVPGGVGGGLRFKRTEGAQTCLPPLVSEGRGPHLGAQQASWAQVGGVNTLHSCLAPLVLEDPSRMPILTSPASLLRPQDQPSPEGTSEGVGPGLRAGQTSPVDWAGETLGPFPPDLSP